MIKKLHFTPWIFTSFIVLYLLNSATAAPALGEILDQDFANNASLSTYSTKELRSPTIKSGRQWERPVILAQSTTSCPCYSLTTLTSTTWNRCYVSSRGNMRSLRKVIGYPATDIWSVLISPGLASCECQHTPSGVCAGKGPQNSDIYHSELADPEMRACMNWIRYM
jgi:hypothetical protein